MSSEKDEAIERLKAVIPYIQHSVQSQKVTTPAMGVLALDKHGSGRILWRFHAKAFVNDLIAAFELPTILSEEESMKIAAHLIVQEFGADNIKDESI